MTNTLIIFCAKYLFIAIILITGCVFVLFPPVERKHFLIWVLLAAVIALILTKSAAALYFDPRPFTHGVMPLFTHDPDNGFPSDHTVITMVAALITFSRSKRIGGVLIALSLIVGLSRVFSGIHNLLDIFAGVLIAIVSVYLSKIIMQKYQDKKN